MSIEKNKFKKVFEELPPLNRKIEIELMDNKTILVSAIYMIATNQLFFEVATTGNSIFIPANNVKGWRYEKTN